MQYKVMVTNVLCVMLFRQEIELKQCSAYGQLNQRYQFPTKLQNVDCSGDYELIGENDGVYEKIPGES